MTPEAFKEIDSYIRESWFKNHKAHYTLWPKQDMETVIWKNPDRYTYFTNYILVGGYLHVTGDIGNAIYQSGFNTLKEWSECDIGYFESKCVASESGTEYKEWDKDFLEIRIKEFIKEYSNKTWNDFKNSSGYSAINYEQEWHMWLASYGSEYFGPDQLNWPIGGHRIAVKCKGHLIGLQMAVEQLTNENILK